MILFSFGNFGLCSGSWSLYLLATAGHQVSPQQAACSTPSCGEFVEDASQRLLDPGAHKRAADAPWPSSELPPTRRANPVSSEHPGRLEEGCCLYPHTPPRQHTPLVPVLLTSFLPEAPRAGTSPAQGENSLSSAVIDTEI